MPARRTKPTVIHHHESPMSKFWAAVPSYVALLGTLAALAGFYFNTTNSIGDLTKRTEVDDKAREQLRETLTKNSEKTSDAIAELSKHAAVQDERTANITTTLQSIQGQLSAISVGIPTRAATAKGK